MIQDSIVPFLFSLCVFSLSLIVFKDRYKWFVFSISVYLSTMAESQTEWMDNRLIGPLETLRHFSRPISFAGIVALILVTLFTKKINFKASKATVLLLILQIYLMLREVMIPNNESVIYRILIYATIFILMAIIFPQWINTNIELVTFVKSIVWTGMIFVLVTCLQLFYDPAAIIWDGRLLGTTGNAQHAATILSLMIIPTIWLTKVSRDGINRFFWRIMTFIFMYFLFWTGSRNGFLMLGIGLLFYFRKNSKKLLVVSTFIYFLIVLMASYINTSDAIHHISGNTENTRSVIWATLFNQFYDHPLIGVPMDKIEYSECSYLLIAARGGIVALILLFGFINASLRESYFLLNVKMEGLVFKSISDLLFSSILAYFTGALFEGYLISNLAFPIFFIYLMLAGTSAIRKHIRISTTPLKLGNN